MKKIVFLLFASVFTLLISILPLFAFENEYVISGDNWKSNSLENIQFIQNKAGERSISISSGEYSADESTELLLHFNSGALRDTAGNFDVKSDKSARSTSRKKYGSAAGMFNGEKESIALERNPNRSKEIKTIFLDGIYSGDFSIEFWIYGQNYSDGETIFSIEGYVYMNKNYIPQFFRCYVENRRLVWHINNFFIPFGENQFEIKIEGTKKLIPQVWSHHVLRYNYNTALLEYLVDGVSDAASYVNTRRSETGDNFPFYSGEKGRILIGSNFTGLLDEFRIKREFIKEYNNSAFAGYRGVFVSAPVDLGHSKSYISKIETRSVIPDGTEIRYYYYLDDFKKIPDVDSQQWKKFSTGALNASGGRFLAIKAELFSDGAMNFSPSVSAIKINFNQKAALPPPQTVRAEAGDKSVRLKWSVVPDPDLDGYYVYFGEASGKYFGKKNSANTIASPIDVGKSNELVITNLDNGKVYYFAVVSYCKTASRYGNGIINDEGSYSTEAAARPDSSARAFNE